MKLITHQLKEIWIKTSAHYTEQLHSEEKNSEVHSEVCLEEKSREQHVSEEQPEQNTEQLHLEEKNLEVHLEEKSREQHVLEEQPGQSLSQVHHLTLQDWLNRESQSHATKYQSHANEVRLEQLPGTKENVLSGSKGHQDKGLMNQKLDDIIPRWKKMKSKMKMAMRMIASLQQEY